MTIAMTCACGRTLRVADEHAGKRVKCPDCAAALTVPGGAPAPRPTAPRRAVAPAPAMIRFACGACGQEMQARAEHAGRAVTCPECAARIEVPGPGAAVTADKPTPRPKAASAPARARRDADED